MTVSPIPHRELGSDRFNEIIHSIYDGFYFYSAHPLDLLKKKGAAPASQVGIASKKPEAGPSVKVKEGYGSVCTHYSWDRYLLGDDSYSIEISDGSPADEEGRSDDEGPQIKVIAEPMWVAKNWAQCKPYMYLYGIFKEFESRGERPVTEENRVDSITAPTELYDPTFTFEYGEEDDQPAVTMTQYSAQQYTKWLSRVTGQQYRLPTEAEWEHAARGGTTSAYSFGANAEALDEYAWSFDNSGLEAPLVGGKKPNPFGLYDMRNIIAELTVNEYTEDGYAQYVDKQPVKASEWLFGLSGLIR